MPGSRNGLDPSLSEVQVASGDTSSTSSSTNSEPSNDFEAIEKAMSGMLVGAGIAALKPKDKTEYDSIKAELESAFKVTTPTAQTPGQNTPAEQQSSTPVASPTPSVAPSSGGSATTSAPTVEEVTPHEQLCRLTALYIA